MRTTEFDSSSEDEGAGDEDPSPLQVSWLPLSAAESSLYLGICGLPGCKYKDVRRSLQKDVEELQSQGVQVVFVFCTRGELSKYRVPALLDTYRQHGIAAHHRPFPDGEAPDTESCCRILDELRVSLDEGRRTLIHCYGGLGRSALIAACLLLQLSPTMTASAAIELLRALRGRGAIQTVKQYNFLQEFREKSSTLRGGGEVPVERSVSR